LHFSRPHLDHRVELTIDRDDLAAAAGLRVLDQEEPLRQVPQDRKQCLRAVDHEAAGHAAEHLPVDEAMSMRVIPEHARPLPAHTGNHHLVLELATGKHMDEDIIAASARRHAQAVEMQVGGIIAQVVPEPDSHGVAETHPQQRRQVGVVVEKPGDFNFAEPHTVRRSRQCRGQDAVPAADFRRADQRFPSRLGPVGPQQGDSGAEQRGAIAPPRCGGETRTRRRPQDKPPVGAIRGHGRSGVVIAPRSLGLLRVHWISSAEHH
jgi:hypothetical protein